MKYTMKQILQSYTPEKRKKSCFWARFFSRPLSFPLTYIFINCGLTANTVSVISMIESLLASLFIMLGGRFTPIGVGMFVLWHILDCCDGNIARVKKTSSYGGEYFDAVSGYTAPAFVYLAVGVAAYHTTTITTDYSYWFIVLGGVASVSDILGRLIYQKYIVTEYRLNLIEEEKNIDEVRNSGIHHIADLIIKNMGFSSSFMPLFICACIFHKFDFLISIYSIYCFLVMLGSGIFFVKKGFALDKRV
ncbi:CDP-alcohol phosphatidyltransferase family protein [Congzhengia minquanensis]|uniref:CDP-alcohol phosphatidyltransferase family protein n=1 Tax=Congzhengia minquanensis TaxID=2763657 RepID=A0A926DIE6_9FIRM|nr:CDP-alcohol phosphatidyltransferase family protein [Congzhengia minquanensis]MBC8539423.1 CDP-alcohol phosphatidyltransferase family protein [Congzhengia minquanensis]